MGDDMGELAVEIFPENEQFRPVSALIKTGLNPKILLVADQFDTRKTALQLHEEWKLTLEHAILSNILQVVAASAWIGLGIVIVIAGRELKRYIQWYAGWRI